MHCCGENDFIIVSYGGNGNLGRSSNTTNGSRKWVNAKCLQRNCIFEGFKHVRIDVEGPRVVKKLSLWTGNGPIV